MATGTGCTYTFTGLSMGQGYYVAVVARNTNNNQALLASDGKISTVLPTFNARTDYTKVTQSGLWNYQDGAGGKYTNLAWDSTKLFWHTDAYVSTNTDVYMTGQNTMWFNPGTVSDSVVTFTAPYTGAVTIKSASGLGIAVGDDSADGIVFTIKKGNTNIFAPKVVTKKNRIATGNNIDFNVTTTVNAGDKIHFIVGRNGNNNGDATYVTPLITYTQVAEGGAKIFFTPGSIIEATGITKTGFTLNWPAALTSVQLPVTYTVYTSNSPITKIPTNGGLSAGAKCTYTFSGLDIGGTYYIAIVAKNAKGDQAVIFKSEKIATVLPTYNAYEEYTKNKQSSSIWRYQVGYSQGNSYVTEDLTWNKDAGYWGSTDISLVSTATSDLVTGMPSMSIHPSVNNRDAVITFIAPYTGTIEISMANGGIFAPLNGSAQSFDGINFKLTKGAKTLYAKDAISSKNSNPQTARYFADKITVQISQGEKLNFIVNANKDTRNDLTF